MSQGGWINRGMVHESNLREEARGESMGATQPDLRSIIQAVPSDLTGASLS